MFFSFLSLLLVVKKELLFILKKITVQLKVKP